MIPRSLPSLREIKKQEAAATLERNKQLLPVFYDNPVNVQIGVSAGLEVPVTSIRPISPNMKPSKARNRAATLSAALQAERSESLPSLNVARSTRSRGDSSARSSQMSLRESESESGDVSLEAGPQISSSSQASQSSFLRSQLFLLLTLTLAGPRMSAALYTPHVFVPPRTTHRLSSFIKSHQALLLTFPTHCHPLACWFDPHLD